MTDEIGVVTQDNCGYCDAVRKDFKTEIANGTVKEYNVTPGKSSAEAREIAKKLGVTGTPTFFTKDSSGNLKACDHDIVDGKVVYKCELPKPKEP